MTNLIARESQLKALTEILQSALNGRLKIVFITGEAGIGKTVLVQAFIEQVRQIVPDLVVAESKCHSIAGGQQEPYLPFVEILQTLSSAKRDNVLWSRLWQVMADLAPDWIQILPGGSVASAVIRTMQWGQREFSNQGEGADLNRRLVQYTNALKLATKTAPLLLWIDDLHWSDNATLDLISFLAEHIRDGRLMLVLSYRPTDIAYDVQEQPHPVKRLVNKLNRYKQCVELPILHFNRTDLEKFLTVSQHHFPKPFVERLWRQSGGNPLFVREYITLLHTQRLVKRSQGRFELSQAEVDVEIPATVQAVITQRLGLIEQDLQHMLAYASVQGERFATRVLAQLLESPELDVLEKLNLLDRVHKLIRELEAQHFIIKVGAEYQFVHVLIQQILYNDLSKGQRRQLHLAIAQLLEGLYDDDETAQYAIDLATHFERGGDVVRAIAYYSQATHSALMFMALDDALTYAERVQNLASQYDSAEQIAEWQIQVLINLAEIHFLKAEFEMVLTVCDQGQALYKQQVGFSEQYAHFLYWRSKVLGSQRRHTFEQIKCIKEALNILKSTSTSTQLQGYLYTSLGELYFAIPIAEAQKALDTALDIAKKYHLANVQARALIQKGWMTINYLDDPVETLNLARNALAIAENTQMTPDQIDCHRLIAYGLIRLKRKDEAFYHVQKGISIARQNGLPYLLHITLYGSGMALTYIGEDLQGSLTVVREAIDVAEKHCFLPNSNVLVGWFDSVRNLGLWQEAKQALNRFCECVDLSHPENKGMYLRMKGSLAYSQARFKDAVTAYQHALTVFKEHGSHESRFRRYQVHLGMALIEAGDFQHGVEQIETAYSYWQKGRKLDLARCLHGLGRIRLRQGNPTEAISYLQQALTLVDEFLDKWPTWPYAYVDLAQAQLEMGQVAESLESASFVYSKFKKWGHFLLGEAAFTVGQVLTAQGKQNEAATYLQEARNEWQRLELTHHLPAWKAFVKRHNMTNFV